MATPRQGRLLVAVLAVIVVASLWRTVALQGEKTRISRAYDQAKVDVDQLQGDRDRLTQELAEAKGTVQGQVLEIKELQQELGAIESRLDETVAELAGLQREHESLRQLNVSLNAQLASVTVEKEHLSARLSDLRELRLAIRDVKHRMHEERWAAWRARAQAQRDKDERLLAAGNRGFVVRNGTTTLGVGPRLHIHVREPQVASE